MVGCRLVSGSAARHENERRAHRFRERAGFTERLPEPELARVWMTPNGRRSLYVLGAVPGALGALALALELGCSDPDRAERLRRDLRREYVLLPA